MNATAPVTKWIARATVVRVHRIRTRMVAGIQDRVSGSLSEWVCNRPRRQARNPMTQWVTNDRRVGGNKAYNYPTAI